MNKSPLSQEEKTLRQSYVIAKLHGYLNQLEPLATLEQCNYKSTLFYCQHLEQEYQRRLPKEEQETDRARVDAALAELRATLEAEQAEPIGSQEPEQQTTNPTPALTEATQGQVFADPTPHKGNVDQAPHSAQPEKPTPPGIFSGENQHCINKTGDKAPYLPLNASKGDPEQIAVQERNHATEAMPEAGEAIHRAEPDQTQPDRNHDFQTELAALVEAIPAVPSPDPKQAAGQDSKTDNAPVTYSLGEYLNLKFEPKIPLLGNDQRKAVLRSKEILMIYSYRGTGKTRFANMLACCLAGNTQFLKWPIGKPDIKVLYIDGELDAEEQQERWPQAVKAAGCDIETVTSNLHVTNKHVQKKLYIPDLNTTEGRNWILQASKGFDVVFYDSMAAFFPRGSRDWDTAAELMNKTLEDVRNINGCAQVILQHEGKGGSQIGSVQNERNVAISWRLREIQNDSESHNHIELTFEKRRNLQRQDAEGLDIVFAGDSWQWKPLTQERDARVIQAYLELNMTQSEIAREEGINQSTVGRILKKAGIDPKKGRR